MSSLAEIFGQRQPPLDRSETTPFVTQKLEPARPLTAKLSTHASGVKQNNSSRPTDLLIEGLIDRLPEPNGLWPLAERARWLRTAASIFDLVYKISDEERGEITKTEGAERPDVEQETNQPV